MSELAALEDQHTAQLRAIFDRLEGLPDSVRQNLSDSLWGSIPQYVTEDAFNNSAITISATAQTGNLFLVQSIYTAIADDLTGFLTLGSHIIPVPSGTQDLTNKSIILGATDVRSLSAGVPGTLSTSPAMMGFVLCGIQLPPTSRLAS